MEKFARATQKDNIIRQIPHTWRAHANVSSRPFCGILTFVFVFFFNVCSYLRAANVGFMHPTLY